MVRLQALSYCDGFNAMLSDGQARGEYVGGYQDRVGEENHSFHLGDADSDEERGVTHLRPKAMVMFLFSRLSATSCLLLFPLFLNNLRLLFNKVCVLFFVLLLFLSIFPLDDVG